MPAKVLSKREPLTHTRRRRREKKKKKSKRALTAHAIKEHL